MTIIEQLKELVRLGLIFRNTPIVDNDFIENRDRFDLELHRAERLFAGDLSSSPTPPTRISFHDVFVINSERANRWHDGHPWNPLEWAGAMCGEAGEAANAAKKLKRVLDGIATINEGARHLPTQYDAENAVVKECCDTILYALLLARSAGASAGSFEYTLREVFNKKSTEYGFPERI